MWQGCGERRKICQHAKRESKKGRARGGIITGVRCEIEEREIGYQEKDKKETWS